MSDEDLSSVLTDLATELAATFPSGDRGDAAALLQDCLLPWELRNYHGHPRPDTLKALVTENLRSVLDAAAPDDRLDTLRHRVRLARSQALEGGPCSSPCNATDSTIPRFVLPFEIACQQPPLLPATGNWRND